MDGIEFSREIVSITELLLVSSVGSELLLMLFVFTSKDIVTRIIPLLSLSLLCTLMLVISSDDLLAIFNAALCLPKVIGVVAIVLLDVVVDVLPNPLAVVDTT